MKENLAMDEHGFAQMRKNKSVFIRVRLWLNFLCISAVKKK